MVTLIGLWFGLDTAKEPRRFISVLGMLVYVGISYVCSVNRRKVSRNLINNCICARIIKNALRSIGGGRGGGSDGDVEGNCDCGRSTEFNHD